MGGGAGVMCREEKLERRSWMERAAEEGCELAGRGVVEEGWVLVVGFGAAEGGKCLFLYFKSTRSSILKALR